MNINVKRLNQNALIPQRGSACAAGYDLYANIEEEVTIEPFCVAKIGAGISIEIVDGYFGAVFARSGLATKQGLRPSNCVGVIDSDYRGEIMVSLRNDSAVTRVISPNDRIAQLVILPYQAVEFNEVEELSDTQRGEGGFGSTGIGLTKEESASWEQLSLFNKEYTTSNDTYTVTVE